MVVPRVPRVPRVAGVAEGGGPTSRGLLVWGVLTDVGDRTESPDRVGAGVWGEPVVSSYGPTQLVIH